MGSSASVSNGTSEEGSSHIASSANRNGRNMDNSLSGGSLSSDDSTPSSSRARSLWSRLARSNRSNGTVAPLSDEFSKTVRKVFDQLEFQNTQTDRLDINSFKRWHDAQKILNSNPQLMMGFITATRSMYLHESKQLVAITNEMVKMDVKNSVTFPKDESVSGTGIFNALISSKSPDTNSAAGNYKQIKVKNKNVFCVQTDSENKQPIGTGNKTPGAESRTMTVKLKKQSLAELIQQQRKSINSGSSYDKRLSLDDHRNLAEILKHANLPNNDLHKSDTCGNSTDKHTKGTHVASGSMTKSSSGSSLGLTKADAPSSDFLYADSGSGEMYTPPIATPQPVQYNRLLSNIPNASKAPSPLPPLKAIPDRGKPVVTHKKNNTGNSGSVSPLQTSQDRSDSRCVSCTGCGKTIDQDEEEDNLDKEDIIVLNQDDEVHVSKKDNAPSSSSAGTPTPRCSSKTTGIKQEVTATSKAGPKPRQSAKLTKTPSAFSRPSASTAKARAKSRPMTGASVTRKNTQKK